MLDIELFNIIASLLALILLEIVLGIDNLVFLSILTSKLPKKQQKKARQWGLTFAWITRLILLSVAIWIATLTHPLIELGDLSFSARDIFLFIGGGFLIVKATQEIHNEVSPHEINIQKTTQITFRGVIIQVGLMDIVFSLDSVITAIGLTTHFWIMAVAITCAIIVMIFASESVSRFIDKNPTIKMLALSFLILIGMVLIADGFSFHIPRAYIYFAMGFSLGVEALNHIKRKRHSRNSKK